jgi:hypothetical protein
VAAINVMYENLGSTIHELVIEFSEYPDSAAMVRIDSREA